MPPAQCGGLIEKRFDWKWSKTSGHIVNVVSVRDEHQESNDFWSDRSLTCDVSVQIGVGVKVKH